MSYKLISRACFSMIVKEERKVITVVFPDGRDGRTFTLKVSCPVHTMSGILLLVFQLGLVICCGLHN